jgi:hypothetical protein
LCPLCTGGLSTRLIPTRFSQLFQTMSTPTCLPPNCVCLHEIRVCVASQREMRPTRAFHVSTQFGSTVRMTRLEEIWTARVCQLCTVLRTETIFLLLIYNFCGSTQRTIIGLMSQMKSILIWCNNVVAFNPHRCKISHIDSCQLGIYVWTLEEQFSSSFFGNIDQKGCRKKNLGVTNCPRLCERYYDTLS